jgi:hypothetical protein
VTGAVREFLLNRQVNPADVEFRVAAPVSVRRTEEHGKTSGNRVSSWSIRLPIEEADPLMQLQALNSITTELKESNQAIGVEMMMALAEWTPSLLTLGARAGGASNNTIVTNVPGPQFPLYLIGAEMDEIYPNVPLMENMGMGIALMSYNGKICWGFNADYGRVSDIGSFVRYIRESFARLAKTSNVELSAAYTQYNQDWAHKQPALPKPAAPAEAPPKKKATRRRKVASKQSSD